KDGRKMAKGRKLVPSIIAAEGFAVNPEKTRILRAGRRQAVTGVIVNKAMGLSRVDRRKLRAALHRQRTATAPVEAALRLNGKLAYLFMLNSAQALALGWKRGPKRD